MAEDTRDNRANGYTIHPDGPQQGIIKPILSLYQQRDGSKNANFAQRQAAGEIVVSPFLRGKITVVSHPAIIDKMPVREKSQTFSLLLLPGVRFRGNRLFLNEELFVSGVVHPSFFYTKFERAYLPPLAVSAKEVFNQMVSNNIDAGLVARQLADINRGTLDVLTAMAEMPKLLVSVINGLALVGKLRKAALAKEISLSAAFDRRKVVLKRNMDRRLANLAARKAKSLHPSKGRTLSNKAYQRQRQLARDTYKKALKASSVEFTDAVAAMWLNFRYNIMPTVYLINDIEDTLAFQRTYLTRRNGYSKNLTITVGGEEHDYTCNSRIFIKRKIQGTGNLNSASASGLVTAWELIPLSFVIDWFVNIGDMIASFAVSSSFSEQGSTWAERKTIDSDVTNDSQQRVTVSGFIYNRQVIDPIQIACLDFKYDMNADRYRDSLALLWGPVRNNLVNRPKRGIQ